MTAETFAPPGSSHIATVSYDSDTQELEIEFQSGDSYAYSSVPQAVVEGFRAASSAGQYFHRQIKGRYSSRPV